MQGIDAVNARKRMLCTLTLNPVNGASGATRAKVGVVPLLTQTYSYTYTYCNLTRWTGVALARRQCFSTLCVCVLCFATLSTSWRVRVWVLVCLCHRGFGDWGSQKDAEGCCWSLWTMERLGQLMMCTPEAVTSMDVRQCTPLNMVFPEVWVCFVGASWCLQGTLLTNVLL